MQLACMPARGALLLPCLAPRATAKATRRTDKRGRPMAAREPPRISPAGQMLAPDRAGHLSESHWRRPVYYKWGALLMHVGTTALVQTVERPVLLCSFKSGVR